MKAFVVAFGMVIVSFVVLPVQAFEILTPLSKPCHERLALGAFDQFTPPFSSPDDAFTEDVLAMMVARASEVGVPQDKASQGAIKYIAETYGLKGYDAVTQYVLSSLLIGVRDPDTRGFSVVRVNVTRSTHIDDDLQDEHALRRAGNDGEEGNAAAIENIRKHLTTLANSVHTKWWDGSDQTMQVVWTFPHYGEQDIRVFGPSFLIGSMVHTVQDSFTHMLRDEDARIVHVLNFVDASTAGVVEPRDGLAHSERLDMCDTSNDTFDFLRVSLARDASSSMVHATGQAMKNATFETVALDASLNTIYDLRRGCTLDNKYCDNGWVDTAREKQTEPVDISIFGCASLTSSPVHQRGFGVVVLVAVVVFLRRRLT